MQTEGHKNETKRSQKTKIKKQKQRGRQKPGRDNKQTGTWTGRTEKQI